MTNMLDRPEMPVQDPKVRATNFEEVALGLDLETAVLEASRCFNCRNKPCVNACPVNIDIPGFIMKLKDRDLSGAYDVISQSSNLPAVCGRVCPQENQCEGVCTRGLRGKSVAIGYLERFIADWHNEQNLEVKKPEANNIKVAIIGSGPAGLTCAGDLAKKGYDVTIFEALHKVGGVLVYGIPEFRLPKVIVDKEVEGLRKMGVTINTNVVIGRSESIDDLFDQGYQAVFVGSGAGLPMFMKIPGESYNGVFSANEFLTRINLMKAYQDNSSTPIVHGKHVVVVGGGNVAMDACRCAMRLGAKKVSVVYRRSEEELPARHEEYIHACEEGIEFEFLTNPTEILGDDDYNVKAIKCVRMELGEADESGRRRPVVIEGSEFELECDVVIMSLGTSPNPLIKDTTPDIEVNKRGGIIVDDGGMTTKKAVYAGGDAVTGAATVIKAMGAGKVAASSIDKYFFPEEVTA